MTIPHQGHNKGPPIDDSAGTRTPAITPRTIFRVVNPNRAYTKLSNTLLSDKAISFECKGFLVSILMLPVDWVFRVKWLCSTYGTGRDKAYHLVNEAIDRGYCKRVQVRGKRGRAVAVEYHFTDDPVDLGEPQLSLPEKPEPVVADSGPTPSGNAGSGRRRHIQKKDSDKGKIATNSPPPPRSRKRARGGSESEVALLIEELRTRAQGCEQAVDLLLVPIVQKRKFSAPDPLSTLVKIAEWAQDYAGTALSDALWRILEERHAEVYEDHIVQAVREAVKRSGKPAPISRPGAKPQTDGLITIDEDESPEAFAAWYAEHKRRFANREPNKLNLMETHRFTREATMFPTGGMRAIQGGAA